MVKEIVKLTIEMLDAEDIETVKYAIENLSRPTFLMEDGSLNVDNVNAAVDALEAFKGPQGNIYIAPEDRKEMVKEVFESWSKASLRIVPRQTRRQGSGDAAMNFHPGGIDLNSANLTLHIKRDGNGMPLPLAQQDLAQLNNIEGLDPVILSIKPASQTSLFSQVVSQP